MTEHALPIILLAGACLSLLGLAFSGLLVSRAQTDRERRESRMAAIVAPHARVTRIELSAFIAAPAEERKSPLGRLGWVFGFDPKKAVLYPVHWSIILLATLGMAKATEVVVTELAGIGWFITIPAAWILYSRNYFNWIDFRYRQSLLQQFPDALAMIVRSIRVGIPVVEAIRTVARECPNPTAEEFSKMVDQVAIGKAMEDAMIELSDRSGLPEYRFFATALSLQTQTGGTLSDTLESLAEVIRKRAALKAKGKAMTSEARTSAMILAALPFLTGGMLYVINPTYVNILFFDKTGQTLLGAAVASLATGMLVIRSIIRRTLP